MGTRGRRPREENQAKGMKPKRSSRDPRRAQPGRQPRNPQPRDSTDHGARGRPHPPAAAAATPGRARGRRPVPAGPGSRTRRELRSPGGSLTIFNLLREQPLSPVTVSRPHCSLPFPGLPPHIRRKCVRPGEEGRRARGAGREPRGAGAPTPEVPRDPGPRAQ